MRAALLFLFCTLTGLSTAQQLDVTKIDFYELMDMGMQDSDSIFSTLAYGTRFEIISVEPKHKEAFLKKYPGPITKTIYFEECIFRFYDFDALRFDGDVYFTKCQIDYLTLYNAKFKHLSFDRCTFEFEFAITDCSIDALHLTEFTAERLWLTNNTFGDLQITSPQRDTRIEIRTCKFDSVSNKPKKIEIGRGSYAKANTMFDLNITNTSFRKGTEEDLISLNGDFSQVFFDSLYVMPGVTFLGSQIQNSLTINNSAFGSQVSLHELVFPASNIKIRWDQLQGNKLGKYHRATFFDWVIGVYRTEYAWAKKDSVAKSTADFEDLIFTYQTLFNNYKLRGDIESANGCYSEMKDLQTARLRVLYKENRSFNNFFRWKLAQLMKIYTNHGTDPALSITISMYVILVFGIFYFFYPSDWDVTSKSRLIGNFKDFIQKNEKGYFKPLIALVGGFMLSLINALTLSLNSFTTLGFGNIPTHGLARYICVIEGFIGWFLLSIFTVALINQVLS